MTTQILLADGHPVVRLGLATALAFVPDVRVAGEVGTLAEAIDALTARPDVAIVELRLPDGDVFGLLREARAISPRTRVVVTDAVRLPSEGRRALKLGAVAYLPKDSSVARFTEVVGEVVAGRPFASVCDAPGCAVATECRLTSRELAVLRLMADGNTNPQIGRLLAIGTGTVRTHVSHILEKLDAVDRTDAVVTALRLGLV